LAQGFWARVATGKPFLFNVDKHNSFKDISNAALLCVGFDFGFGRPEFRWPDHHVKTT